MVEIFASLKLCLIQPDLLASEDSLGEVLLSAEEVLGGDNCLNCSFVWLKILLRFVSFICVLSGLTLFASEEESKMTEPGRSSLTQN